MFLRCTFRAVLVNSFLLFFIGTFLRLRIFFPLDFVFALLILFNDFRALSHFYLLPGTPFILTHTPLKGGMSQHHYIK